jgi:predicted DNA-binding transcriptional regulator AlpA
MESTDSMKIVSTTEVVALTGIERRKVLRLVKSGKLKEMPLGFREKHFRLSDVYAAFSPTPTNSDQYRNN